MRSAGTSSLRDDIDGFLRFKRSLGYKYVRAEFWLKAFARFVEKRPAEARSLQDLTRAWLARNESRKAASVAFEFGVLRQLFGYLQRRDPGVVVPARDWAPRSSGASEFLPHILQARDFRTLLCLAEQLRVPPFYAKMYRVLLLVLYCTGVRFGEAVRLKLRDLDMRRRALWIAESKGRSRWVPFHGSLAQELARYLKTRKAYAPAGPDDTVFVGIDGAPLRTPTASHIVTVLLRRAHLKPPKGRIGPRPYDLRHYPERRIIPTRLPARACEPAVAGATALGGRGIILMQSPLPGMLPGQEETYAGRLRRTRRRAATAVLHLRQPPRHVLHWAA